MNNKIQALKVKQWLQTWESVEFDEKEKRSKPDPHFYMFSISAKSLKKLSGVYRRSAKDRRSAADEFGIQRKHDPERSETIREYVINGYPWSDLSASKRESGDFEDLKKPGWLPTAIVVNILKEDDTRRKKNVSKKDLITINENKGNLSEIILPEKFNSDYWSFENLPPIEIIDGQHRLWAFEDSDLEDGYDLPVVAFHGLDISWQAYLFYTINISPKKINRSLAYDLYPLLRTEDWLERFEGHIIYRETRAQELVDMLYSHPESPWYQWINMLGDTGGSKMNSQSAWIRSLLATFVKKFEGRGTKIGGIFGVKKDKDHETVLPWGREEQVALLIYIGKGIKEHISESKSLWAQKLREGEQLNIDADNKDPAFYGKNTLLNHDQGIRALLQIINDFLYLLYEDLELESVFSNQQIGNQEEIISSNLDEIRSSKKLDKLLNEILLILSKFDWRSYGADGLSEEQKSKKAGYRGSGGYKVLRIELVKFLNDNSKAKIKETSQQILKIIGD